MNIHESEKIAGILESRGYSSCDNMNLADIIVFNTCCIREGAESRALGNIGKVKILKKKNPNIICIVAGCMPQQDGKEALLHEKYPYIDIVVGTHNIVAIGEYLDELLEKNRIKNKSYVGKILQSNLERMDDIRAYRTSGLNAWVNISYGCNNFCTYCIVPYVRGREVSRSMEEIETEVRAAVISGYKEITLLGQNVNSYGNDITDGSVTFSNLLKRLSCIDGEFRIKYMTSHPKDFNDDIIEQIVSNPKVAKYIHLPIQSGSNSVLTAMNRRYTREDYLQKIEKLKAAVPDCGLSSDIMIGFPGETESDFLQTMDMIERVRFDNLFMFVYSRRSGTVADKMENQVPEDVKTKRINTLVKRQREIACEVAKTKIGKTYHALAEFCDGKMSATTDCGRFVNLPDASETLHGQFVQVEIIGCKSSKLIGKILS